MRELILPILFVFSISSAIDIITPSHPLSYGETLISANGSFALGFFTPPNTTNRYIGIWYNNIAVRTVVWVANRRNPVPNLDATLSITPDDASLHLKTSGNSTTLWSSSSPSPSPSFPRSFSNPIAQLLDTGNLVVKSSDSRSILWQSFDHPTDTLLQGMKIGRDLKTGIDRNLTAWLSPSDPSPGSYALTINPIGVPQMVTSTASGRWIWRGGPWNGFGFSGAGPNEEFNIELTRFLTPSFNSTPDEIYYSFTTIGDAISPFSIDPNGKVRRTVWHASSRNWSINWYAPRDACDFFAVCGINSVCDSGRWPICRCLDGFDPRNRGSWGNGDWSEGCVRAAALSCEANGTDEFAVVSGAKLPDTTEAVKDLSLGLNECRARCLMNCSCKVYANAYFTGGGTGCIIWTGDIKDVKIYAAGGEDLYVRVARRGDGSKKKTWVFAITAVVVFFLLIILMRALMKWRRRHKYFYNEQTFSIDQSDELRQKIEAGKEGNSEISLYQFTQVVTATNNFSDINKLGEGGFGPVYKMLKED